MDALEAIKTRRSVRAYERRPVAKEVLEDLVDCGRLAPTALNIQPWEFVVVTEPERLRALAAVADHGPFIRDAAACIVVLCRQTKYYLEDGSAATENILIAAHAHGLGACWIAGDKKPYAPKVLEMVGAPPGYKLISLISVGYPAEKPFKQKRPLAEVLHWERF